MNPEHREPISEQQLDALLRAAGQGQPAWADSASGMEFGFETRVLARVREQRSTSWLTWAWRLCPIAATLAIAATTWTYIHRDESPDSESVYDAVRLGGISSLHYYLGGE